MSDILMDLLKPRIEQEKREYAEKREAEVNAFWKEKEAGWLEEKEELLRKLEEMRQAGSAVTA